MNLGSPSTIVVSLASALSRSFDSALSTVRWKLLRASVPSALPLAMMSSTPRWAYQTSRLAILAKSRMAWR